MEGTNGSLKGPKAKANGVNAHINGKTHHNGHINTKAVVPRRRTTPQGPGLVARGFSIIARLLTYYSILTLLFRCPSTLEACDETSPRICKPYFQVKQAITPHIEPYYNAYAAPYVELAKPYYNTLDRSVITPGKIYAVRHGAPQVLKAKAYTQAQWEKRIQPQLHTYQSLAKSKYDQSLAPHVTTVSTAAAPYYDIAKTNALQTYHELLLPSYQFLQPHAHTGYQVASTFAKTTALPSAVWAWNKTYFVLDGVVWPQIRSLYIENVEPQLHKIGERLGRYNDKSSAKPVGEAFTSSLGKVVSSFTKPTQSVASTAVSATASTSSTTTTTTAETHTSLQAQATVEAAHAKGEQIQAPDWEQGEEEDEIRREARETVAADLKDWQDRYSKAADEGANEIEERVDDISKRLIRRNARTTGKDLLAQLQSTVVSELVTLRRDIQNIVGAVSKGSAKHADAEEQITSVVRRAGMAIKEKALGVREWRESYEAELHGAVTTAADNHFKILDSIRDLAIQKIGMKWAWMDGVTYRDWQKYHLLKDRFDEWHGDLEKLIVTHPGLEAAQIEGAAIEEEAMNIAQSAAKELARLKQVANWKLVAVDATDEFDAGLMKQAADAIQSAKAAASPVAESATSAASVVSGQAESATASGKSAAQDAASAVSSGAEAATAAVKGAAQDAASVASSGAQSATASAKSVGSDLSNAASSVLDKTSTAESLASKGSESISSATEAVASKGSETFSSATEAASSLTSKASDSAVSATSKASETVSSATDAASTLVAKASGSAASVVSEGSETISSATEAVASATEKATDSVVSAIDGIETPLVGGGDETPLVEGYDATNTPNLASSVTEQILTETPVYAGNTSEVEEEGLAPVEILVDGEELEEPVIESIQSTTTTSVKSAWFGAAAQAVPSRQVVIDDDTYDYLPEGMSELPSTVSSMAHSAYSAALSQASAQYSQALSVVSVQIHGTPKPAHEQMLASVTSAYSNAMASASSKLDSALKVASGVYAPTTTTGFFPTTVGLPNMPSVNLPSMPTMPAVNLPNVPSVEWAQIESIASQRLAEGRTWAEEQYESAKIRIGLAEPTPSTAPEHAQKLLENARHNYYAGLGVAYARYSEFLAAASSAVSSMTATPTPNAFAGTVSSLASVASESASSAAFAAGGNASDAAVAATAAAASAASVASASAASVASIVSASAASAASIVGDNVSSVAAAGYDAASSGYDSAASVASIASASAASVASVVGENASSVASAGYDAASSGYDSAASVASIASASAASAASVVGENASSAAAAGYDAASAGYESAASVASAGYDNVASAAGVAADTVSQNWDNVVSQLSIQVYGAPTPTPWYESMYSVLGGYAASATDGAASATSSAGDLAASATGQAAVQYHVVSSIISELVVGKEPTFSESVFLRLNKAYSTGFASASSLASVAQESAASVASAAGDAAGTVVSAASAATEAAKESAARLRDEL